MSCLGLPERGMSNPFLIFIIRTCTFNGKKQGLVYRLLAARSIRDLNSLTSVAGGGHRYQSRGF